MSVLKIILIIGLVIVVLLAILFLVALFYSVYLSIPYDEWVEMQKKNRKTKRGR